MSLFRHMDITIAAKVPLTEAEGPGKRFAVWVQGCPFRCPGCCNPQYLSFKNSSAVQISTDSLTEEILGYEDEIEGVTFIGGEPMAQAGALAKVAEAVRKAGLSVMVFSGYTLEQLEDQGDPDYPQRFALLQQTDLLVDGQYERENAITDRRWIGSSNQKVHFLSDRYLDLKERWPSAANTIEIRYKNGELTINGFPHPEITRKNLQSLKK
ncbi:MAG: 4Fe-4S single cluster domain-containing protein [Verrucomicrobiales bacterium]|nr:4Fe-4S single cluster domain-containing protein [Verrucomicrobiales bacterium]